jgi:hypothetical protein
MAYKVFDCTKATGSVCMTRSKIIAYIIAVVLSKLTKRFHDYDAVRR